MKNVFLFLMVSIFFIVGCENITNVEEKNNNKEEKGVVYFFADWGWSSLVGESGNTLYVSVLNNNFKDVDSIKLEQTITIEIYTTGNKLIAKNVFINNYDSDWYIFEFQKQFQVESIKAYSYYTKIN